MTNAERKARIDEIWDLAASEHRDTTKEELDEIEQLSHEIFLDAQKWQNEMRPIPEGAMNALPSSHKASIEGVFNTMHSTNA